MVHHGEEVRVFVKQVLMLMNALGYYYKQYMWGAQTLL